MISEQITETNPTEEYIPTYLSGWANNMMYKWNNEGFRRLPLWIDDLSFGLRSDIYDQMMLDSQIKSCIGIIIGGILAGGINILPFTDPGGEPLPIDVEIANFCSKVLNDLETPLLTAVLPDMLAAIMVGNRIAELVYHDIAYSPIPGKLVLKAIKVKARNSVAFVVDEFLNIIGIAAIQNPGTMMLNTDAVFSPEKFTWISWNMVNSDPRGQALDPNTPIPTPDGWKKLDDLHVGDKIFDEQGRVRYVTNRRDWEDRPAYAVVFKGEVPIIADANHLWPARTIYERKNDINAKPLTTEFLYNNLFNKQGKTKYAITCAKALDYPEQVLLVHPYYLGAWLGNGTSCCSNVACHLNDAEEWVELLESCGYDVKISPKSENNTDYGANLRVHKKDKNNPYNLTNVLRALNVINNKHIPEVYLRGSMQQRLDLLSGLMDTDGSVDRDGRCEFTNTNKNLVEGVVELVNSLGVSATLRLRKNAFIGEDGASRKTVWACHFTPTWVPFKLKRKAEHVINMNPYKAHYIISINKVSNRRTVCITVDSPSHLYLAGKNMVPTHNSSGRAAYDPWWFKQSLKPEYMKYLTRFASESVIGKTAQNAQKIPVVDSNGLPVMNNDGTPAFLDPAALMLSALEQLRNGAAAVFPFGSEVEALKANGNGDAFQIALNWFDTQMAKAILFQTLATEQAPNSSRGAAAVHQDALSVVFKTGKLVVEQMLHRVLKILVSYNFKNANTPIVKLPSVEQQDLLAKASAIAKLQQVGYLHPSQFIQIDADLNLPARSQEAVTQAIAQWIYSPDTSVRVSDNIGGSSGASGGSTGP